MVKCLDIRLWKTQNSMYSKLYRLYREACFLWPQLEHFIPYYKAAEFAPAALHNSFVHYQHRSKWYWSCLSCKYKGCARTLQAIWQIFVKEYSLSFVRFNMYYNRGTKRSLKHTLCHSTAPPFAPLIWSILKFLFFRTLFNVLTITAAIACWILCFL